jgi:hypothetical protein
VFVANSCEKFEAKISEKSEKKGSEYLKRTSESHVKRISVRLLFALKRKKILSETGAPYVGSHISHLNNTRASHGRNIQRRMAMSAEGGGGEAGREKMGEKRAFALKTNFVPCTKPRGRLSPGMKKQQFTPHYPVYPRVIG